MKLDKTEREFREELDAELPELPGDYSRFQVGNALIKALGLEFREEGEGLPKVLAYSGDNDRGFNLRDGDGKHLATVAVTGGRRNVDILLKALGRYNDFSALADLAREMGKDLEAWRRTFREKAWDGGLRETDALLARLRELLPGEEEGS